MKRLNIEPSLAYEAKNVEPSLENEAKYGAILGICN